MKRAVLLFVLSLLYPQAHADRHSGTISQKWKNGITVDLIRNANRRYGWIHASAAQEFDIGTVFGFSMMINESNANPNMVGAAGEVCLMQIMEDNVVPDVRRHYGNRKYFGNNLRDPKTCIRYAYAYMRVLIDRYGCEGMYQTAHAYNAGPSICGTDSRSYSSYYMRKLRYIWKVEIEAGHVSAGWVANG